LVAKPDRDLGGILTRKALKGAGFNGVQELAKSHRRLLRRLRRFVWRKRDVRGSRWMICCSPAGIRRPEAAPAEAKA